jgi:[ribosomal protein S5]-alanine N-acetyltransferase
MNLDLGNAIRLTELFQSDKESLVELLNNREIYRGTLRIPFPYTGNGFDAWFVRLNERTLEDGQPTAWAIRDGRGRAIGGIGLDPSAEGPSYRAEIGYWLGQPFWGRGIMTSAVQAVSRHGFEELKLGKITAHVFSFNVASARVVEKAGFQLEGYLRKHFLKDGEFIDAKAYGLVR